MSGKSALILGATGAVGKHLLKEILTSSQFTRVGEFGRKVTLDHELYDMPREKLVQKTIDFLKLDSAGLLDEKWDVVFITLGTTRAKAGSAEQFIKIDRDYVIDAARAAKNPQQKQQLIYCSVSLADPKSHNLYLQSKGQAEHGLASLGYADTIIFRPGMLLGAERAESRPAESIANAVAGVASHFTDAVGIQVATLARSMRIVGELGSSADLPPAAHAVKVRDRDSVPEYTVIENKGALRLAQSI